MLDLNLIEKMQSAISSAATTPKEKFSKSDFYSLLVKHQLNMIQAWSPAQSNSLSGIKTPNLTEVFLNFNKNPDVSVPKFDVKTQKVLQSYQDVVNSKPNYLSVNKGSLSELANQVAKKNNVPEKLFQKLIQTESAFDPTARSSRGAMGLGQLMPPTAKELGLDLKEDSSVGSILHPESNLDASARYLRKLFDKYTKEGISGDEAWSFAAGAYNAGMGNIAKAIEKVGSVSQWDQVAAVLPQVTGQHSSETIRYVNSLRA